MFFYKKLKFYFEAVIFVLFVKYTSYSKYI